MRAWLLGLIHLLLVGCTVPVPRVPSLDVRVSVQAEAQVVSAAPSVALEGAAVVEFFGIPLDGAEDVVFVLDRSGSMNELAGGAIAQLGGPGQPGVPRKIDVAHHELIDAVMRLPMGTRVNVVFFNNRLEAFAADMVELDEAGREQLADYATATFPHGPTALAPAMRLAFLMHARRVILLSDGLGNVGGDAEAVLRDAREAMLGRVRIDTVGLGPNQDAALLYSLAHESGGLYQRL